MKAVGGAISGLQAITNDANQVAKFEDCLVVGTFIGGKQAGVVTKNKGIVNLNTVVIDATFEPDKAYVVGCDLRNGTGNNITTTSVLYTNEVRTDKDDATKCKGVYQLHANNTVDNPTATKITVDNLKTVNTWAATQSIAGFSDWTATLEEGGIKMPITEALAAAVVAFSAPPVDPDAGNNGAVDNGGANDGASNNATNDTTETTDTAAPETTKAAETTEAAKEKGCGGVIGAGLAVVSAVALCGAVATKKRRK